MQILPKKGYVLLTSKNPPHFPRLFKETDIKGLAKAVKTRVDLNINTGIYDSSGKEDGATMGLVAKYITDHAGANSMDDESRKKVKL